MTQVQILAPELTVGLPLSCFIECRNNSNNTGRCEEISNYKSFSTHGKFNKS